jgi:hypothetical protein
MVYVGPGVMFAFVPAFGVQLQCLIIAIFILFTETLQADITAYIVIKRVTLKEKKQSRYPWGGQKKGVRQYRPTPSLFGEPCRNRTCDLLIKSQLLYLLS